MKQLVLFGARRVLAFLPFLLLVLPLSAATHTVQVGVNSCGTGLNFVDSVGVCSNQSTIAAGDMISWVWGDNVMSHSATSGTCVGAVCQATPYWNSGEFFTPHTFNRIFYNPGVFPYFCTVHDSNMVGTLRVLPTPATFTLQTPTTPVGTGPFAVAVGDFNGDGKPDLAVANKVGNSITILLGNGDGTFTQAPMSPITGFSNPTSIAVADFRGIGRLDLAVVDGGNTRIAVLLGNGDGTFAPASSITFTSGPQAVVAADFDGDGKMDIAAVPFGPTQNNVGILRGNGDGSFQSAVFIPTGGSAPLSLFVFDLYRHGKPDLAMSNSASNNLSIFLNTSTPGSVSFRAPTIIATGISPQGITAGTFNDSQGNPTPGIAVANQGGGNNTISVFLKNSMDNFLPASGSPFTVGTAPMAVAAGDFNGDGYLDLATVNTGDNSVTTVMNDAAGSFTSFTTIMPVSSPRSVAVGDFNGDGKPDLAVANFTANTVSILLNTTVPYPPATPGPATHFGITVQSAGPPTPEGNPSTTAGVPFQITVTAYDAYQKVATGYNGMVHFTSSDLGMPVLPGDYTFTGAGVGKDNGVHIFNVTLKTAGFQTIEVHDTVDPTINARSSDILVNPAPTSRFVLVAPPSTPAGSPFNFSVTAQDAFQNQTPNYAGTVQFSSLDTNTCVVLPMPAMLTNGVGNFSAKLITVGSQTLTARDSVTSSISGMATITVQSGTLHFTITPSATTVLIGSSISITVSARDVCENLATTYVSQPGNPVHFSSSLGATVPANYLFTGVDGGTHTFTNGVTFNQQGGQTVSALDSFYQISGISPVINVLGATTVSLAPLPKQFLLRQPITLTATVQVTLPSTGTPTGNVSFFDGAVLLGTRSLSGNQASFISSQWKIGKHSLTAIYNGDANFAPSPSSPVVVQYKSPKPH